LNGRKALRDQDFMALALQLARAGLGSTAPNPTVGCVLMQGGAIVGRGATGAGGRPHAEEVALLEAAGRAAGGIAYVTLEPCALRSSGGKSCATLLAEAGLARVVIASPDPHPNANGGGTVLLQAAGARVELGLMQAEAEALNAGFFHRVRTGLPLIEASDAPEGFDALFEILPGESPRAAAERFAAMGLNRLRVPPASLEFDVLRAAGLLGG
jgi:diaminohydroxyphosphoribosylaminopyrimidine deaminase / 5-amino-6-(5-phosphoribosylamino)uracil reductase